METDKKMKMIFPSYEKAKVAEEMLREAGVNQGKILPRGQSFSIRFYVRDLARIEELKLGAEMQEVGEFIY